MNKYPTPDSPWYVVYNEGIEGTTYYQSQYSEYYDYTFHKSKRFAQIYVKLKGAVMVARATQSSIRVLFSADEAKEFGYDGSLQDPRSLDPIRNRPPS